MLASRSSCSLGCRAAEALLALFGFAARQNFWTEYLRTLKVALPLAIVFGLGALAYASLRGRLEVAELRLHEKELAEERTRKLAAEARLRSLESWIHPHFLFNTLNSISALIASDPARAEQIVGRLATLLRASLDSSNHSLIPLRQEIAMVESYADIERVRFGDKLRCSVNVPPELQETKVPPLSVQSLVENAVKHGITPQPNGGEFQVTARAANDVVYIEVRDSGPGFDFAAIPGGHGLDKLVQRLDALYGANASLSVSRRDGYSVVEMIVPRVLKLRAYLVDDEPLALDRLRRLLDRTGRVEVIGATTSPEDAVAALTADPPDVCFLDIQMPRLNGFEVLARLPTQPIVVFTTAYDQYALKAFGVDLSTTSSSPSNPKPSIALSAKSNASAAQAKPPPSPTCNLSSPKSPAFFAK